MHFDQFDLSSQCQNDTHARSISKRIETKRHREHDNDFRIVHGHMTDNIVSAALVKKTYNEPMRGVVLHVLYIRNKYCLIILFSLFLPCFDFSLFLPDNFHHIRSDASPNSIPRTLTHMFMFEAHIRFVSHRRRPQLFYYSLYDARIMYKYMLKYAETNEWIKQQQTREKKNAGESTMTFSLPPSRLLLSHFNFNTTRSVETLQNSMEKIPKKKQIRLRSTMTLKPSQNITWQSN